MKELVFYRPIVPSYWRIKQSTVSSTEQLRKRWMTSLGMSPPNSRVWYGLAGWTVRKDHLSSQVVKFLETTVLPCLQINVRDCKSKWMVKQNMFAAELARSKNSARTACIMWHSRSSKGQSVVVCHQILQSWNGSAMHGHAWTSGKGLWHEGTQKQNRCWDRLAWRGCTLLTSNGCPGDLMQHFGFSQVSILRTLSNLDTLTSRGSPCPVLACIFQAVMQEDIGLIDSLLARPTQNRKRMVMCFDFTYPASHCIAVWHSTKNVLWSGGHFRWMTSHQIRQVVSNVWPQGLPWQNEQRPTECYLEFLLSFREACFFGNSCKVIVYKMISGYMHVPVNFHCANSDLINFIFAPVRWMLISFVGRPGLISVLYSEVASASSLACNSIFDVFFKIDYLKMCLMLFVAKKSSWYLICFNSSMFLDKPFFWVRKTCPQISSNFTEFTKISNTPFVSFGCCKKNKATNYTTNLRTSKAFTFHRKTFTKNCARPMLRVIFVSRRGWSFSGSQWGIRE